MAPVGGLGVGRRSGAPDASADPADGPVEFEPISLNKVLTNEVGFPGSNADGSRGVYSIVFKLSAVPSHRWADFFVHFWDRPQVSYASGRHRPGMASVVEDRVVLEETTIDEVEGYHLPVLKAAVRMANDAETRALAEDHRRAELRRQEEAEHRRHVAEVAERLSLSE